MTETTEKSLLEKVKEVLKEEGLEVTEEAVKAFIPVLMKVLKVFVEDTETKIDDMAYGYFADDVNRLAIQLAEKINKADNE